MENKKGNIMNTQSNLNITGLGISENTNIYRNLPVESLIEETLLNSEGVMGMNGAVMVDTGTYTGRSPNDNPCGGRWRRRVSPPAIAGRWPPRAPTSSDLYRCSSLSSLLLSRPVGQTPARTPEAGVGWPQLPALATANNPARARQRSYCAALSSWSTPYHP